MTALDVDAVCGQEHHSVALPTPRGNGAAVARAPPRSESIHVVARGAGEGVHVRVTMRNTGSTTWRPATHALGTQCPRDSAALLGGARVALPHDVPPRLHPPLALTMNYMLTGELCS